MPSEKRPLSKAEIAAYEDKRDLAAELLQSVREMKAGSKAPVIVQDEDKTALRLEWFDAVVVLTALTERIGAIVERLESGGLDDDETYELEERLNDYQVVAKKLKVKLDRLPEKGELPDALRQRLAML